VGVPADSFEWRWQARALLGGGVWWQSASDLAGDARLRAWAELGLPPAGGLSLVISHLPAFEWGGNVSPRRVHQPRGAGRRASGEPAHWLARGRGQRVKVTVAPSVPTLSV
jgi:hypothetical protein